MSQEEEKEEETEETVTEIEREREALDAVVLQKYPYTVMHGKASSHIKNLCSYHAPTVHQLCHLLKI